MVWLYNSFSCVRGRILIGVIRRGMSFHHFLVCMNTSNSLRAYRLTGGSELPSPQRSIIGPLLCNGMRWSLINPFDVGVRIDIYFPHSFFLLACHNRKKRKMGNSGWHIHYSRLGVYDAARRCTSHIPLLLPPTLFLSCFLLPLMLDNLHVQQWVEPGWRNERKNSLDSRCWRWSISLNSTNLYDDQKQRTIFGYFSSYPSFMSTAFSMGII